jgi:signal transduction histidine kinase
MAPPWWRTPLVTESALTLFIAVLALTGTAAEVLRATRPVPPAAGAYLLAALASALVPLRHRYPVGMTLTALGLVAAYHLCGYPGEALAFSVFVGFYSIAAYAGGRRPIALAFWLSLATVFLPALPPHGVGWTSAAMYGAGIVFITVVSAGAGVRHRRTEAEERLRLAELSAQADMRERMSEERLRIARELHDVLAHTISVIAVQGGLALDALDDSPETTRRALTVMRTSARDALAELRAALTTLRGESDRGRQLLSQPSLAAVSTLAGQARAAGLDVHLDAGDTEGLPPAVELTAYRIVQEATTNAVRHAGARSLWIRLRCAGSTLRVEVGDDGCGLPGDLRAGMGLRGMRERAESVGGTLRLGARTGGGCQVLAELPLSTVDTGERDG